MQQKFKKTKNKHKPGGNPTKLKSFENNIFTLMINHFLKKSDLFLKAC